MKRIAITTGVIFYLLALAVYGQQAPAPHPAPAAGPKPPTLTHEQKEAYWKAVAQQYGAQKQLDAASNTVGSSVQAMILACGAEATLQQAPNGDPECWLKIKPKPAEVEPKK